MTSKSGRKRLPKKLRFEYGSKDILVAFGPIISAEISVPISVHDKYLSENIEIPEPVKGYMILDTGASQTTVSETVVKKLKLIPISPTTVVGVHGEKEVFQYYAHVNIAGNYEIEKQMTACNMKGSLFEYFELYGITIIGLIGRDFLKDRILEFNGITGTVTITTNTE